MMDRVYDKIENAEIAYLANIVKSGKKIYHLHDEKFAYIKEYPPINFNNIDWSEQFPILVDGCNLFYCHNLQNTISDSLAIINPDHLSAQAILQRLQSSIQQIETDIVAGIQNNMPNIETAIENALRKKIKPIRINMLTRGF